ncbi:hypothetical protein HPB50_002132 [Hyalomma asiaticum]|uniref:Uncharacterized protein n=1 Tax=Hyalomma asiaticum TaxID=266040 RepID=A0ACB7RMV4_HYAAI|nr:hypothetical protein HPB50_002132 [Hyalomma asiaticum]
MVSPEDTANVPPFDYGPTFDYGLPTTSRRGGAEAPAAAQVTPVTTTSKTDSVSYTTSRTTGTPTTTKTDEPVRFLCTVGPAFTSGIPLPKDGLCTLVFFDSLYAGGTNGLDPASLPANVMAFLQWALSSAGGATQFGVSLAIDDQNLEMEAMTKRFESGISWLSAQKIAHFGFLNAYLKFSSTPHITKALKVLKHESVELLRRVDSMPDHPALVLSLSLHGRIYVAKQPDDQNPDYIGTFSVFNKCNKSEIVAPSQICSSHMPQGLQRNYVYNRFFHAAQTFDKMARKASTFESEEAITAKVCDIKETALALEFSIAAYDIEKDSANAPCSALTLEGSYARVSLLEKLNRFVVANYKAATHKADCFLYAKSNEEEKNEVTGREGSGERYEGRLHWVLPQSGDTASSRSSASSALSLQLFLEALVALARTRGVFSVGAAEGERGHTRLYPWLTHYTHGDQDSSVPARTSVSRSSRECYAVLSDGPDHREPAL